MTDQSPFPTDYWLYDASTTSFDLTRGNATNAKTLKAGKKTITVNPEKSALIVVDMQSKCQAAEGAVGVANEQFGVSNGQFAVSNEQSVVPNEQSVVPIIHRT